MPSDSGPSPAARARRPRPRGGALALALVLALFGGSLVVALLRARTIEGAVPGRSGVLSIAVTGAGYVVGTTDGAFASADGTTWAPIEGVSGPAPVTGDGDRVLIASGTTLYETTDLGTVRPVTTLPFEATAIAAAPGGAVYAIDRAGNLAGAEPGAGSATPGGRRGPASALGLGVTEPGVVFAGSLVSGLWRSEDGGGRWTRILETPAHAVLAAPPAAPGAEDRILLATPGGVLVSRDGGNSWELSALEVRIEGLAHHGDGYYAVTSDRLLLRSPDGETDWQPLAVPPS
jgi:photosystem II stability/assembly factor-like uncharacterized protein